MLRPFLLVGQRMQLLLQQRQQSPHRYSTLYVHRVGHDHGHDDCGHDHEAHHYLYSGLLQNLAQPQ
jgi:hypothetical protein